jgi:hypothetical protein
MTTAEKDPFLLRQELLTVRTIARQLPRVARWDAKLPGR